MRAGGTRTWMSAVVLVVLLCAASIGRSAVPKNPFLGIPPQDESYYKTSSGTIKCKDGSFQFTKAQLNDDFCDCPDGTDEPGTSACPSGRFYCQNAGHIPGVLFSSRVNDGICDCCDGSDEYDGQAKCPNTCWEAGKVARDKLKKKIATYKEGVSLRKKEIEQAKLAIAKDEAELSKLKNEENILKGLVNQLKERKEQIEKAEEKERLQKEKEEKERKEAEEKATKENSEVKEEAKQGETEEKTTNEDEAMNIIHDKIGVIDDTSLDQDMAREDVAPMAEAEHNDASEIKGYSAQKLEQHVSVKEEGSVSPQDSETVSKIDDDTGNQGNDISENTEELSREELGRLVASRWTGSSEKQTVEADARKDKDHEDHEDHEEVPQDTHHEEDDGYASETDDDTENDDDVEDTGKYDDVDVEDDADEHYGDDVHDDTSSSYKSDSDDELDFSDTTSMGKQSWLEKIQNTVRNILQAVNLFQTPVDKSEAAHVRKEYEESNSKLTKIQSRISSLTQKLKHDFGKEKEFYLFYDHCFETRQNKYVYKVCPFKHASQAEGQSSTRLGRWDKLEDSARALIFSNGDKCWNGPDRSIKVKLRCGLKNELTDVDEPSRCEYVALLSTPAVCLEEKLKELEDKLDSMNKEQPQSHDEL